jgi:glycosyltransferase 2 family protein
MTGPRPGGLLRWMLRIVGSAALIALLFVVLPTNAILSALSELSLPVFGLCVAGFLLAHVFGIVKWQLMLRIAGCRLLWLSASRCYLFGLFGNVFLPSLVGGDVVSVALALQRTSNRLALVLGTLLARLLDLIVLGPAAVLGLFLLQNARPFAFDVGLSTGGLAAIIPVLAIVGASATLLAVRRSRRLRRIIGQLHDAGRAIGRRPVAFLSALVAAMLQHASLLGLAVVLGKAIGLDLPLALWLFAWTGAKIAAFLPAGQAGIGTREAAFAAAVAPFGIEAPLAVAVSLAWEAVLLTACLAAGALGLSLGGSATLALLRKPEAKASLAT